MFKLPAGFANTGKNILYPGTERQQLKVKYPRGAFGGARHFGEQSFHDSWSHTLALGLIFPLISLPKKPNFEAHFPRILPSQRHHFSVLLCSRYNASREAYLQKKNSKTVASFFPSFSGQTPQISGATFPDFFQVKGIIFRSFSVPETIE